MRLYLYWWILSLISVGKISEKVIIKDTDGDFPDKSDCQSGRIN